MKLTETQLNAIRAIRRHANGHCRLYSYSSRSAWACGGDGVTAPTARVPIIPQTVMALKGRGLLEPIASPEGANLPHWCQVFRLTEQAEEVL